MSGKQYLSSSYSTLFNGMSGKQYLSSSYSTLFNGMSGKQAIDDSLNCTSDIIDEDCDQDDGRYRFDSWLKALRGTYSYVCEGSGYSRLRKLLRAIPCWSLEDFIFCCEEQLGLTHIQNLLYTEFSEIECR
ncbi:hypothetical protein TNIN_421751 [Trichonephila inaurata madagascariensis]|uniref:Uncharacterized protein n=1 Tax=Trichonephila inaurata madagascariensis TaxID=2747483 RepID=A0A8X7C7X0_9ARAC|nr:hypothetical protein TNIN_421751 [Trichonephila inaurata madagascariensis]